MKNNLKWLLWYSTIAFILYLNRAVSHDVFPRLSKFITVQAVCLCQVYYKLHFSGRLTGTDGNRLTFWQLSVSCNALEYNGANND